MKSKFMVLNTKTHYTEYEHKDVESAKEEAIRLAKINQNDEFIILQQILKVKVDNVIIEEFEDIISSHDDMPF